jgi:predicted Fe-Mo cluster-binding NifX family protein
MEGYQQIPVRRSQSNLRFGDPSNQGVMMKIAISARGRNLEAQIDPRFGRAPYFLFVDTDTMECQAVPNQSSMQATQGAGIQAASLVASQQPAAVLTGNCGPNAFKVLKAAGIPVVIGAMGKVKDAVQSFQAGILKPADHPNVASPWR